VAIDAELPTAETFASAFNVDGLPRSWEQNLQLTAREIAMLGLITRFIDKPGWHSTLYDTADMARWREAESQTRLISEAVWQWCLVELLDKAAAYVEKGRVLILDSGSRVAKADNLVPTSLQQQLLDGFVKILQDADASPPISQQMRHVVNPYSYPLVYGT
jgi:hypothetical protein